MEQKKESQGIDYYQYKFENENFFPLVAHDGVHKLATYRQPAVGSVKGVVVFFHGYGSYCGLFAYIANFYSQQGYDFIGYDSQGFGRSEGDRGNYVSREDFYLNGVNFLTKARQIYKEELYPEKDLQFISVGYSQGGVCSYGIQRILKETGLQTFDKMILIAPNFKFESSHLPKEIHDRLALAVQENPNAEFESLYQPGPVAEYMLEYIQFPHYFKGPHKAQSWIILMKISEADELFASKLECPVFMAQGSHDITVDNVFAAKIFETFPSKYKTQGLYEGEHPVLSNGFIYQQILNDSIKWIESINE